MNSTQSHPLTVRRHCHSQFVIRAATAWLTAAAALAAEWPPAPPIALPATDRAERLPESISAAAGKNGMWAVIFSYKPDVAPQRGVFLAGSFNSWSSQSTPMTDADGDGVWTAQVSLGPGEYQYKYVVDGDRWVQDPLNREGAPDNHGGNNSVLRIGKLAALTRSAASVGDGQIDAYGLLHQPNVPMFWQRLDEQRVLVRYRTLAHDVSSVSLAVRDGPTVDLHLENEGPLFAIWETAAALPLKGASGASALEYVFVLEDKAGKVTDPRTYRKETGHESIFHTPEWARHAVWYQIMVDRFRNGSPENDPDKTVPWTHEWFSPANFEGSEGQTFYKYFVFFRLYGGDFQGVEQQLGYLKELGVNALYFNPVFKAPTHHKYDADNYLHIDDHFGVKGDYEAAASVEDLNDPRTWTWTPSDKVFLAFLKKAKSMGFRVIIDGVFNHVGVRHPAFQDLLKNGKDSQYADWFDVTSWEPFTYNGWAGVKDLPAFRKSPDGLASDAAKQHIFNVTRRWMDPDGDGDPRDGIDGWRLDVPNEIPAPFWVEWRDLVKSINPDAYIVGEIWDRADQWLDGRHFDAVMNYPFARNAVAWIGHKQRKLKASQIDSRLAELRLAYPSAATYVQQNLTNSHDTDRLVSMMLNPDREYDAENRVQDNGPDYNNAKPGPLEYARARLVVLLQMTYVGAPMVYYGDEVGMWGADDPTCRKPMLWEDLQPYAKPEENFVMNDQLAYYREVIALRNANSALRTGYFRTLLTDDAADVWAFERANESQRLVVALNASPTAATVTIPVPQPAAAGWEVVFAGGAEQTPALAGKIIEPAGDKLMVHVPAIGGVVLRAR